MDNKVCVIGAGTMGWSIAQVFAAGGRQVRLCDQRLELAQKGRQAMARSLQKLCDKGRMEPRRMEEILALVQPGLLKDAKDCGLAVEAIYENMEAKKQVFLELEACLPEDAVLASNTSSLSITELASCLKNPSRAAGMHFFNPAAVMQLVEVIAGEQTSPQVLRQIMETAQSVGKMPVQVQESAGFVVNRILITMVNEAVGVLAEGVASAEDIDTAMKLGANHPMGPLALADLIGLDVCLAILEVFRFETGQSRYSPHPLLRKMVRAGRLGRKTGQGFFSYEG